MVSNDDENYNKNYYHYFPIWNTNLFPITEKPIVIENITINNIYNQQIILSSTYCDPWLV